MIHRVLESDHIIVEDDILDDSLEGRVRGHLVGSVQICTAAAEEKTSNLTRSLDIADTLQIIRQPQFRTVFLL